ncbi:DUF6444 domain-containing protein [Leucothrix mucor]
MRPDSSKAPSTDSPEQRHQRKKRPKPSRSKGAQPGHKNTNAPYCRTIR